MSVLGEALRTATTASLVRCNSSLLSGFKLALTVPTIRTCMALTNRPKSGDSVLSYTTTQIAVQSSYSDTTSATFHHVVLPSVASDAGGFTAWIVQRSHEFIDRCVDSEAAGFTAVLGETSIADDILTLLTQCLLRSESVLLSITQDGFDTKVKCCSESMKRVQATLASVKPHSATLYRFVCEHTTVECDSVNVIDMAVLHIPSLHSSASMGSNASKGIAKQAAAAKLELESMLVSLAHGKPLCGVHKRGNQQSTLTRKLADWLSEAASTTSHTLYSEIVFVCAPNDKRTCLHAISLMNRITVPPSELRIMSPTPSVASRYDSRSICSITSIPLKGCVRPESRLTSTSTALDTDTLCDSPPTLHHSLTPTHSPVHDHIDELSALQAENAELRKQLDATRTALTRSDGVVCKLYSLWQQERAVNVSKASPTLMVQTLLADVDTTLISK